MPDMRNKQPFSKVTEGDFQHHIMGKRARRRRNLRLALRYALTAVLVTAALAGGFVGMDALLRISEQTLPAGERRTQPPVTAELVTLPEREGPPMRSFYVPINMMDSRDQSNLLQRRAADENTNTAVMTFKCANGYLTYRSNLMQLSRINAGWRMRYRTDWTLRDMKRRSNQRVVAVIHCFDDPLAAAALPEAAVLHRDTATVPWKDAEGRAWLNPWSEPAREYLLAVIREVANFGIEGYTPDDILLCGVRFPEGNLAAAVFPGSETPESPEARNAVLRDFLAQAKQATGETAALYVLLPAADAANGSPALGGDLWGSAADTIAVDQRAEPLPQNDPLWKIRPVIPVVAAAEDAGSARDYIVLVDDPQG